MSSGVFLRKFKVFGNVMEHFLKHLIYLCLQYWNEGANEEWNWNSYFKFIRLDIQTAFLDELLKTLETVVPWQVILDSMLIHTYDASLEYRSSVHVTVNEHLDKRTIEDLLKFKSHKLEILVENMGRTNIGWDMKKLRKGNLNISKLVFVSKLSE